jgi:hypothetical protein
MHSPYEDRQQAIHPEREKCGTARLIIPSIVALWTN